MTSRIFTPHNAGFGDRFASIQLLARLAVTEGPYRVAVADEGRATLHHEIVNALDLPVPLNLTAEPGNTPLDGFTVWACDYFPTKTRWDWTKRHDYVVYQFDGLSSPEKNPALSDQRRILDVIHDTYHLESHQLGKHLSVQENVNMLAGAAFFVGCDSGMSHLAHSVGTPLFLLEYGLPVVTCHRNKSYILCAGAGDFIDWKLPTWVRYRNFLGIGL